MQHIVHPLCNATLHPAEGDEGTVDVLHVQQGSSDGVRCIRSFWKPSGDDLVALLQGGCVALTVLGSTHAPLRLDVQNPDVMDDERQSVWKTVNMVVRAAEQSGYEVRVWQKPLPRLAMGNWYHMVEVTPRFKRKNT